MPELSAEAVAIRSLVEELAGRLQQGQPGWQELLARARSLADGITDPVSRSDAELRIANIDHVVALYGGRPTTALAHLDRCLAIIADLRRTAPEAELARLNDQEWGVRLNRCQVWQALGDLVAAQDDIELSLALAEESLEPDAHRVLSLMSVAAIRFEREDWAGALAGYGELVEQCRRHAPDGLGIALIGLAQCQARTGSWDEAARTADRAEPLLGGDVDALAALHQVRALVAVGRADVAQAGQHFARHAAITERHAGSVDAHHRSEAAKGRAFAAHNRGDLPEACRLYRAEVDAARAAREDSGLPGNTSALRLLGALAQAAGAIQDFALSRPPSRLGRRSPRLHAEALAMTDEACHLALAAERRLLAAALDVQWAKFVLQWHPHLTAAAIGDGTAALERCLPATVFLHHDSYLAERSEDRRAVAGRYAAEAFTVSFALAFGLGRSEVVAELIELRAATGELPGLGSDPDDATPAGPTPLLDPELAADAETLGAVAELDLPAADRAREALTPQRRATAPRTTARLRDGLLLNPPPPLRFSPDRLVLADAFVRAGRRYDLAADERSAVSCW